MKPNDTEGYYKINESAEKLGIVLDPWQEEVLATTGNLVVRSGRQVGKSSVIALKTALYALNTPKQTVLVIASVERQAYLLFEKILATVYGINKNEIKTGAKKPTKSKLQLKNGSIIYCLPTGLSGYGIRGYTINKLIADEAQFIHENVWAAVTPMIATTHGTIELLSTPCGKEGYYFNCFSDPSFKPFHVSSEKCKRIPETFLNQEKSRMSKLQYAQEYLGEFIDNLRAFFPNNLIDERMCALWDFNSYSPNRKYFLGVDIARYGGDESTFVIGEMHENHMKICHIENEEQTSSTHVLGKILALDKKFKFNKIYIDDGGMGAPILDFGLKNNQIKRKLIGINNSKKVYNRDEKEKTLMKQELYSNLLTMMEKGEITFIVNEYLRRSLRSIQYEYTEEGKLKIFGRYAHITEGLIRAAWAMREESLNIWFA